MTLNIQIMTVVKSSQKTGFLNRNLEKGCIALPLSGYKHHGVISTDNPVHNKVPEVLERSTKNGPMSLFSGCISSGD